MICRLQEEPSPSHTPQSSSSSLAQQYPPASNTVLLQHLHNRLGTITLTVCHTVTGSCYSYEFATQTVCPSPRLLLVDNIFVTACAMSVMTDATGALADCLTLTGIAQAVSNRWSTSSSQGGESLGLTHSVHPPAGHCRHKRHRHPERRTHSRSRPCPAQLSAGHTTCCQAADLCMHTFGHDQMQHVACRRWLIGHCSACDSTCC